MGCDQAVTGLTGKLMAFIEELKLWKREMEDKIAPSSTLNSLLEDENIELPDVRNVIMEHFKRRAFEFECYWPEDVMEYS
jgi:hypothetical protein